MDQNTRGKNKTTAKVSIFDNYTLIDLKNKKISSVRNEKERISTENHLNSQVLLNRRKMSIPKQL